MTQIAEVLLHFLRSKSIGTNVFWCEQQASLILNALLAKQIGHLVQKSLDILEIPIDRGKSNVSDLI